MLLTQFVFLNRSLLFPSRSVRASSTPKVRESRQYEAAQFCLLASLIWIEAAWGPNRQKRSTEWSWVRRRPPTRAARPLQPPAAGPGGWQQGWEAVLAQGARWGSQPALSSPLPALQELGSRATAQGGSEPANRLPAPTCQGKRSTKLNVVFQREVRDTNGICKKKVVRALEAKPF